jgi:hypothetical protein
MKKFFEALLKRRSLFIILIGALLLVVGIAQEIKIYTWSLQITDTIGKWVILIAGILIIPFGAFLAYKEFITENNAKQPSSETALSGSYGIRIVSPKNAAQVESSLEVSGIYQNKPPDGSMWLFSSVGERY